MCDTWVALSNITSDGNVIVGKNSDRPISDCQPLLLHPRQEWPSGSTIELAYVRAPQVQHTYATLGSSPYWCWGYEEGINEHSVVIGNEALFTKSLRASVEAYRSGQKTSLGLLGMELVRLALERSRNAAEAVEVMSTLIEEYGQFGSGIPGWDHAEGSYDGSFIIADRTESWIMEAVGRRWAARRFVEGYTSISNEPTIRTDWDCGSSDLKTYALEQGWWRADSTTHFDFARSYIDGLWPRQISHLRLMRTRQLLAERAGRITLGWMKRIARDHYEDSFLQGPAFDATDPDFYSICLHASPAHLALLTTASSCIAVLLKTEHELPVFWWTPGPPCNGCYVPFFVHSNKLPAIVSNAGTVGRRQVIPAPSVVEDHFAPESYWWLFRRLLDVVKGDPTTSVPGYYPVRNRLVRACFDSLEAEFAAALLDILQSVGDYASIDEHKTTCMLDQFTARCVDKVVTAINELLRELDE
jgi:secernin